MNDLRPFGSNQTRGSSPDRFGALGGVAHDENRLAQTGSFLLDASGICQDQVGLVHERNEMEIGQGFDKVNVPMLAGGRLGMPY